MTATGTVVSRITGIGRDIALAAALGFYLISDAYSLGYRAAHDNLHPCGGRGAEREVHQDSRGTNGAPRIHAELRIGLGLRIGRKRVARLMRAADIHGVSHCRERRYRPDTATQDDLVKRRFTADGPDRVWFTDITQHRASDGWVYCCAVIDAWRRRVVGWAIADHVRSDLVVDALEMAR